MPIDQPDAVRWTNERIRPAADLLAGALSHLDAILIDARPDAKDMRAVFAAADPAEPVADGAPGDGRSVITAGHVLAMIRLAEVMDAMADDDRDPQTGEPTGITSRGLIHRLAVNPRA